MAAYFHAAQEIQHDGLQTLYLMNPASTGNPDALAQANMAFLNSSTSSLNQMNLFQSHQPHHFVGIPVQSTVPLPPDSNRSSSIHYNLWSPITSSSIDMSSQLGLRPPAQQRLSLSLSEPEIPVSMPSMPLASTEEARAIESCSSSLQSALMNSKYLKVTQQLLDEVVSVEKGIKMASVKGEEPNKSQLRSNRDEESKDEDGRREQRAADLTTAERQELQMKKSKLVNMLEEVEQRYRHYHHQMQIVISSFEAIAGIESARTYTALALRTISKQFRCLRDAITSQIRTATKSLGEEDCFGGGTKSQSSRLQLVDHHLRQQRALQQIGMIQHNAWRPQRGLPERSVSILRAWLFEHFLHPYPKDSDKQMLAKQTGLTRGQVSNWFINARVRLWKPMVEEMYLEEVKEKEQNNGDKGSSKSDANEDSASKSSALQVNSPTRTEQTNSQPPAIAIPSSPSEDVQNHASYSANDLLTQSKLKKARSDDNSTSIDFRSHVRENEELVMKFGRGFEAYQIGEMGRFENEQFTSRFSGNGVSLTLGLTQCESLTLSGSRPPYLSSDSIPLGRRLEMSTENNGYSSLNNSPSVAHSSNAYDSINIQSRKRFGSQLLQDFVA